MKITVTAAGTCNSLSFDDLCKRLCRGEMENSSCTLLVQEFLNERGPVKPKNTDRLIGIGLPQKPNEVIHSIVVRNGKIIVDYYASQNGKLSGNKYTTENHGVLREYVVVDSITLKDLVKVCTRVTKSTGSSFEIGQRILVPDRGLFYPGIITEIHPDKKVLWLDDRKEAVIINDTLLSTTLFEDRRVVYQPVITHCNICDMFRSKTPVPIGFGANAVRGLFLWLNERIWDNKLPPIQPQITQLEDKDGDGHIDRVWGRFAGKYAGEGERKELQDGSQQILLSEHIGVPYNVLKVMVHEMAHYAQAYLDRRFVNGAEDHDETFYKWQDPIKEITGITITEKWDADSND